MSWVAVGVAAVAAVSYISSSNTQKAQANQEAATDTSNANQAIANMQAVEAQASAQELAQRAQSQQYLGQQRASMADSGTGSLSSGSNYDVARQSATNAEVDALNIQYQGQLKGNQYLQSAYNYEAGAEAAGAQASQIASNMYVGAGTAALSSYASSYSRRIKGTANLNANGYSNASGSLS